MKTIILDSFYKEKIICNFELNCHFIVIHKGPEAYVFHETVNSIREAKLLMRSDNYLEHIKYNAETKVVSIDVGDGLSWEVFNGSVTN